MKTNRIFLLLSVCLFMVSTDSTPAQTSEPPFEVPPPPELSGWTALPEFDDELTEQLRAIVEEVGLDEMTPAADNPDEEEEWSSICLVDLGDFEHPRVAGWKADNFIYPASTYKVYVLGEAIRQVVAGEIDLGDAIVVKPHNVRSGSRLEEEQVTTVSEVLRLMMQYSDNTAANEAIDLVDRKRASALMHALENFGSEVTRKYLSRSLEDEGYADVASTATNALHMARFLYAVETAAIGGGRGRGLIKGYMAMVETNNNRFRAGLPESATIYSKTGTWNIFTSEAAIVEDGETRYILCAFTPYRREDAETKLTALARRVHELLTEKTKTDGG